jgi:hypothetical protein
MRSGSPTSTFDIGSLDLVREFVEHVVTKNALAGSMDHSSRHAIDWDALEASIANSSTLEQAIGRAIVIADQMGRGVFHDAPLAEVPTSLAKDDPFFSFSMADVVPDFGDESRYRSRMVRKVARVFGSRRTMAASSVS